METLYRWRRRTVNVAASFLTETRHSEIEDAVPLREHPPAASAGSAGRRPAEGPTTPGAREGILRPDILPTLPDRRTEQRGRDADVAERSCQRRPGRDRRGEAPPGSHHLVEDPDPAPR